MQPARAGTTPLGSIYVTRDRLAGCLAGMLEGAHLAGCAQAAGSGSIDAVLAGTGQPAAQGLLAAVSQGLDPGCEEIIATTLEASAHQHANPSARAACVFAALWSQALLRGAPDAQVAALGSLCRWAPGLDFTLDPQAALSDERLIPRFPVPPPAATLAAAAHLLSRAATPAQMLASLAAHGRLAESGELSPLAAALVGLRDGLFSFPEPVVQAWRWQAFPRALEELFSKAGVALAPDPGPPRTSLTHPLRIDSVAAPSGALIGMTLCPGKRQSRGDSGAWDRDLAVDMRAIAAWGATALVTLLPWEELHALGAAGIDRAAAAQGIEWLHAPMVEGRAPGFLPPGASPSEWFAGRARELLGRLSARLAAGHRIVIHCKGGLGRTGVLAAALLLEPFRAAGPLREASVAAAIAQVRAARRNAIETVVQERSLDAWNASDTWDWQGV